MIVLIAAVASNGVIGTDGTLPWSIPEDMRRFRHLTLGNPVVMGRRTFTSIGRPLPGRTNIVLTRNEEFAAAGATIATSIDEAIGAARDAHGIRTDIYVIGGGEVYGQFLAEADRLEITEIETSVDGDTVFPQWDPESWSEVKTERHDGTPSFVFRTYERAVALVDQP